MKRELARRWAKALESGEIAQTTGVLRDSNGMCCLGVLCNLHAQDHPEIAAQQTSGFWYCDSDTELPEIVQEWAGMLSNSGAIHCSVVHHDGKRYTDLMSLNDDAGMSFPEIAKVIRKHYKEL